MEQPLGQHRLWRCAGPTSPAQIHPSPVIVMVSLLLVQVLMCMPRRAVLPKIATCLLGPSYCCGVAFLCMAQAEYESLPANHPSPLLLLFTCFAFTYSAGQCWGSITTTASRRNFSRVASHDCQRQAGLRACWAQLHRPCLPDAAHGSQCCCVQKQHRQTARAPVA